MVVKISVCSSSLIFFPEKDLLNFDRILNNISSWVQKFLRKFSRNNIPPGFKKFYEELLW